MLFWMLEVPVRFDPDQLHLQHCTLNPDIVVPDWEHLSPSTCISSGHGLGYVGSLYLHGRWLPAYVLPLCLLFLVIHIGPSINTHHRSVQETVGRCDSLRGSSFMSFWLDFVCRCISWKLRHSRSSHKQRKGLKAEATEIHAQLNAVCLQGAG